MNKILESVHIKLKQQSKKEMNLKKNKIKHVSCDNTNTEKVKLIQDRFGISSGFLSFLITTEYTWKFGTLKRTKINSEQFIYIFDTKILETNLPKWKTQRTKNNPVIFKQNLFKQLFAAWICGGWFLYLK